MLEIITYLIVCVMFLWMIVFNERVGDKLDEIIKLLKEK